MYVYIVLMVVFIMLVAGIVKTNKLSTGQKVGGIAGAMVVFIGLFLLAANTGSGQKVPAAATQPTSTTSTVPAECATWKRVDSDKTNNRWFADGIAEIKSARSPEEARKAAHQWSLEVRKDPVIFSGAAQYLLNKDVKQSELFDGKSCATSTAVGLYTEMEVALALASVTADEAPANGFNSGVANGTVTSANQAGITGDRKAIKVVLKDGTTVWILGRCGQIVVISRPPVPQGPTDEQPTATTTSTTSRVTTTTQRSTTTTQPPGITTTTVVTTTTVGVTTTTKKEITLDCRLNPNNPGCPTPPIGNPPQDNSTSGVNTGPTPGAPVVAPAPSAAGPAPVTGTPAPAPVDPSTGGPPSYDSGSGTGSGTPGGSTCGTSCSGGGPTPAAPGTPPVVDSGTYTTDDGGF